MLPERRVNQKKWFLLLTHTPRRAAGGGRALICARARRGSDARRQARSAKEAKKALGEQQGTNNALEGEVQARTDRS
jgi:hypothetical protein